MYIQVVGCPRCLDKGEQIEYNRTRLATVHLQNKTVTSTTYKCKNGHVWHETSTLTYAAPGWDGVIVFYLDGNQQNKMND